ncbi:MAG: pentapeptide repeat-containing protein [Deltaproteobacteria bacterium]|nr:pentapeptide repeat-containing protein [Deltaproteobacteria bacterium]
MMPIYEPLETYTHADRPLLDLVEEHGKWLKGGEGARADLRRAELKNANLKGLNLVGADLREAALDGACLNHADLRGADLRKAHLDRAALIKSRLIAANMAYASMKEVVATRADFTEANLLCAELERATLNYTVLKRANLREASLTGANLVKANLSAADLSAAEMDGTILSGADLTEADLRRSRLTEANLLGVDLRWANLEGADLRRAKLGDSRLMCSKLTQADLSGANLNGACFEHADLSGWGAGETVCEHLLISEEGETSAFGPGKFLKKPFSPQPLLEFSLPLPLAVVTAYLAKFFTQALNAAMGSTVVSLKGMEALSTYETKMLMVCHNGGFYDKVWKTKKTHMEKAVNRYFRSDPVRRDYLYLGEVLSGSAKEDINFGSCPWMLDTPRQINPALMNEEILEHYRRIGDICKALQSLIRSVISTGVSRSCEPLPGDAT